MNYIKLTKFDTSNGPGIRTVLWVSGCNHKCKECHNPETWDKNSGKLFTESSLSQLLDTLKYPYIRGLTFSGGDPLYPDNRQIVTHIAKVVKETYPTKDIWLWTGYLYEEVKDLEIMNYVDVLVDGPFILSQKDITLPYSGSSNQRVLDIKRSLELNSPVLIN